MADAAGAYSPSDAGLDLLSAIPPSPAPGSQASETERGEDEAGGLGGGDQKCERVID